MSPEITAAFIAAGVGALTVIDTVVTQYLGRRATSRDPHRVLDEQRKRLDRTLAAQSDQLDRTLAEQRTRCGPRRSRCPACSTRSATVSSW